MLKLAARTDVLVDRSNKRWYTGSGREKGNLVINYRRFLIGLIDQLGEAIREAENWSWHHKPDGTVEAAHYNRLLTWLAEVDERLARYDSVSKT